MKQHDRLSVTDKMIAHARQRWPDAVDFDFVECTNCTFVGLVQLGEENCPDCGIDSLQWAAEDQKEFSL